MIESLNNLILILIGSINHIRIILCNFIYCDELGLWAVGSNLTLAGGAELFRVALSGFPLQMFSSCVFTEDEALSISY